MFVNPELKGEEPGFFSCDLRDVCVNPKERSSSFCVSPGISL